MRNALEYLIRTALTLLSYFDKVRERSMRLARCVPPGRLDWSCLPDQFTLGDLPRHLAVTERFTWPKPYNHARCRYQHQHDLQQNCQHHDRSSGHELINLLWRVGRAGHSSPSLIRPQHAITPYPQSVDGL
jgi:hypothetical protein